MVDAAAQTDVPYLVPGPAPVCVRLPQWPASDEEYVGLHAAMSHAAESAAQDFFSTHGGPGDTDRNPGHGGSALEELDSNNTDNAKAKIQDKESALEADNAKAKIQDRAVQVMGDSADTTDIVKVKSQDRAKCTEGGNTGEDDVPAAVVKDGRALQYADAAFKEVRVDVPAAVTEEGSALQYADAPLKMDKGGVLKAIARPRVIHEVECQSWYEYVPSSVQGLVRTLGELQCPAYIIHAAFNYNTDEEIKADPEAAAPTMPPEDEWPEECARCIQQLCAAIG